jgi:threonine dehydrogenase-like Zn-dependent dehydrogenase
MKALVFNYNLFKLAIARIGGFFSLRGYLNRFGAFRMRDIPYPRVPSNWVVVKTKYCGICGSDHKQVFLDGNRDNPMTSLISWPQVLGHEAVGIIDDVPKNSTHKKGDRVVLNPWLSCQTRGIDQECKYCLNGKNSLCRNFTRGSISPGIHSGNSSDATGGFAEFFPAHNSMAVPIPDDVSWKQALLSDPFSVAFHSILKVNPEKGSVCAVYGCGNLGLLTVLILKSIFDGIKIVAIARFKHQADLAKKFGADIVIDSNKPRRVIEQIADYVGCDIYSFHDQLPWLIEGVDYVFDTVASRETLETEIRFVKSRKNSYSGTIIVTGVSSPKKFEWTPWYFKEIRIIGSNAFAIEEYKGYRGHAYEHYFKFLEEKTINPVEMVTHEFPLSSYKKAFLTARNQEKHKSVKVIFSFDNSTGDIQDNGI